MNIIKPKKLRQGDTISIIAPSGAVNHDRIFAGKKYFEEKGYNVKFGKNLFKNSGYMSADDEDRLEDLHNSFDDKDVDAIVCARGGYGTLRLVDKIDYSIIKSNPKIFCGFSDITVLNSLFLNRAGLVTFSGPMIQSDFAEELVNKFTEDEFFNTLTSDNILLKPDYDFMLGDIDKDISGKLFGGNLASLASLCGIDFLPDEKFILFVEDISEPVYKIDRYFTQLFNEKDFRKNVQAIVLGDFSSLDLGSEKMFDSLLLDLTKEHDIPVISGFPFGHVSKKYTIPVGANAIIKNNIIEISDFIV